LARDRAASGGGLGRRLLFSLLPLLVLLAVAELSLRLAGYRGQPDREVSWCREHAQLQRPFFRAMPLDGQERAYYAPAFAAHPRPFPVKKEEHQRRVFVLGGSAAHGYGFSRNGSFPGRLQELLGPACPGSDVQVINAGTIAASSQQLLMLAKEILTGLEPDLLVVYAGNNELLEWWDWRQYLPPAAHRLFVWNLRLNMRLSRLRSYLWAREALRGAQAWGQTSYSDDEALPWEQRARMEESDRAYAAESFERNLGRLLDEAEAAGVPVLLVPVATNWMDPPGIFWHAEDGGEVPQEVGELLQRAHDLLAPLEQSQRRDPALAAQVEELFEQAFAQWPEAITQYRWGELYRGQGLPALARPHLLEAIRLDENPHRAPPYINAITRRLAAERGLPMADGEQVAAGLSRDGIIGWKQVYDHCHPTMQTHWALAGAVAEVVADEVWPAECAGDGVGEGVSTGLVALEERYGDGQRLGDFMEVHLKRGSGVYAADPETEGRKRWQGARVAAPHFDEAERWNELGLLAYHHFQADCRPERGPCLQEALDAFRQALEADPGFDVARQNLEELLAEVGMGGE